MSFPLIDRVSGGNTPGCCYLDVIATSDVTTVPDEWNGNVVGDVVPVSGKTFSRVHFAQPGSRLLEKWLREKGEQFCDLTIDGTIGKDELAKLMALWELGRERFIVLFYGLNGDMLLVGTKEEGCSASITERDRGSEAQLVNGYTIRFSRKGRRPAPFYNGTPPVEVVGGTCPTVEEQVALLTGAELYAIASPTQQTEFLAAAGVLTFSGIRDDGGPYTDSIINT